MKIRNGFVSNSSSTSFCIYGKEYSEPLSAEVYDLIEEYNKFKSESEPSIEVYEDLDGAGLIYVGVSYLKMRGYETQNEFIERCITALKNVFPEITNENIEFLYGSYYS